MKASHAKSSVASSSHRRAPAGRGSVGSASRSARSRPPADDASVGAHKLAARSTSFLGRAEAVSELTGLLERTRLLTLTGAPGIGKSRLGVEVARAGAKLDGDGSRLVELAPITGSSRVVKALAAALSVQEVPGRSLMDAVVAHVGDRHLLVVLDNCEHVIGACVQLVETLLSSCPRLTLICTSREPLKISEETVWQVPPLAVPDRSDQSPEALIDSAAVRLFVERAATVEPGFDLNAYVAPTVAEICRRLDGIPLAIELAAARVQSLTPAEIARRLDDRFNLLTQGSNGSPAHHHTLLAALDWSHDLLPGPERALLRRLSVFAGGFDVEAAEAICVDGEVEADELPDVLERLATKSLVVVVMGRASVPRYRLLDTIRAFGADRLEESGEAHALREAHARFYLALAERAEPELTGPSQQAWLERLETEHQNLRVSLEWWLGHGGGESALRLAGALVLYWRVRCHFSEGRELLEAAVAATNGSAPALRAKALWGAGFLTLMGGDYEGAMPRVEDSLAFFHEHGDPGGRARALLILGNCRQYLDDGSALPLLEESATLARETGDLWCLAHALGVAGFEHIFYSELPNARAAFEECLAVARRSADPQSLRMALIGLGSVAVWQGDYSLADSLLGEALALSVELDESYAQAVALQYLGDLALGRGDYRGAEELLDEALALMPDVGPPGAVALPLVRLGRVAHAAGDRPSARAIFEKALSAGVDRPIRALQGLAELAAAEGDLDDAHRRFEEVRDLARTRGDKANLAGALHGLGELTRSAGYVPQAARLYNEALGLQQEIGEAPAIAASLEAVAGLAALSDRCEHAARLMGAAGALRDANGYAREPWESARYQADMAMLRDELCDEELEAAFAAGARWSIEEAVTQAARGRWRRPATGWPSLTEAEQQVVALVAEGLTNPEIAERLFITLGTVKAHLSHIFSKLGITGRRELVREFSVERRDSQAAWSDESIAQRATPKAS